MQVELGGAAQDEHSAVVSSSSGQQEEERQHGEGGEGGEVVSGHCCQQMGHSIIYYASFPLDVAILQCEVGDKLQCCTAEAPL